MAVGDVATDPAVHARLIEMFREMRRLDHPSFARSYARGRIDGFAEAHHVTEDQLDSAEQDSLRLADVGGAIAGGAS